MEAQPANEARRERRTSRMMTPRKRPAVWRVIVQIQSELQSGSRPASADESEGRQAKQREGCRLGNGSGGEAPDRRGCRIAQYVLLNNFPEVRGVAQQY